MFLSCSHLNVSSFAPNVSAAVRVIRTSCELRMAMFVRPRDYVCAPLQLRLEPLYGIIYILAVLSSRWY
jgi:hypothetical protein